MFDHILRIGGPLLSWKVATRNVQPQDLEVLALDPDTGAVIQDQASQHQHEKRTGDMGYSCVFAAELNR
ncbi:hypothetical protein ACVMIH_002419 [Bradyrhizobium sp. USDA 4503]